MTHLISTAWALSDTTAPTGFGEDLANFALRERIERVVIANVLAVGCDPWKVFGGLAFHEELGEFSPLVRNAHQLNLTWILGAGDRVLGNAKFAHIKTRLENRGVTFIDSPAPVLQHDHLGKPILVMVMADGRPNMAVGKVKHTLKSRLWLAKPRLDQDTSSTEGYIRSLATRMAIDLGVKVITHDLPALPSWQRIGPHAGSGVWFGCPGNPPNALLLDAEEPWNAKLIRL